jgi:tripartite-type tricarboxylate transporter receptor subunit TctC
MTLRTFLQVAASAALMFALIPPTEHNVVHAQSRTLRIIVPYAAGGGGSVLARVLADQIERQQGIAVVVENKPGAGTVVGTEAVAHAAANGNTVLITNAPLLTNPIFRPQNYDPLTSFEPLCELADAPAFITVNSASPYRTLADFLNAARAAPGQLTMATFTGTSSHIALEVLKSVAKVDITFVPFPGSGPAVTALLGGHVTAEFDNYATVAEHVNAGKLRVLATASPTRLEALPNVPTVAEAGYPGFGITNWWGAYAPAHTPRETVARLAVWFGSAAQVPEVKDKLTPLGFYAASVCGSEFAGLVRKTYDDFGRAIREANIKME